MGVIMRFLSAIAVAFGVAFAAVASAEASVITFNGYPATSFTDGTFSVGLLGNPSQQDGFYSITGAAVPNTTAFNGYGANGEYILFNMPVELVSLTLSTGFFDPTSITVSLYDSLGNILGSQTTNPFGTMTFDQFDVSKLVITFTGGTDIYSDRRIAAIFDISDVTYNETPLPAALPLFATGLGALGLLGWRRKRKALAA